jgi:uncharacterized SAM-binding protein YcdF (DUF218 family)
VSNLRRQALRLAGIAFALGVALFVALLIMVDQFGAVDRAQPADVIVLLGSMVYPGGQLGPALERRAQHAAALYRRGLAAHIICSGGIGANPPAEAVVVCGRLAELGVPPAALILESDSHNTEQNAHFTTAIMRSQGWHSAVLASDGFHLFRATQMFEHAGVSVYPSPAEITAGPMNPVERIVREMREVVGILWFWARAALGLDEAR